MARILVINGPNLGALGRREPEFYGPGTVDELMEGLRCSFPDTAIDHVRTDLEGEIVQAIQASEGGYDGVVLNAGGYTHTSVAIRDAVASVRVPVVEVHLTNLLAREEFRHRSLIAPVCAGCIMGFGHDGYRMAVDHLLHRVR
ncbi:MAG: type II 3-dehydroquinate dehydratase [Flavobacteriales bacterium]|nr:type II 3-dehydroquinate dehydratase [Flavobacteriales bacterium]MCB9167941.1 type II 3-dehydroquinate dehydratase [Flavobacteriales bacterium]